MKTELLKILRESDGYVSGQQLCERFHVSRTAVWKVIQQLKEEGYEVEAVKNRGYRIMTTPDVITQKRSAVVCIRTGWLRIAFIWKVLILLITMQNGSQKTELLQEHWW